MREAREGMAFALLPLRNEGRSEANAREAREGDGFCSVPPSERRGIEGDGF
jgi:hypothetical protein